MTRIAIDPALRGHVSPALLERLRRAGLAVHLVGRAAYVHDAGAHRWIVVVGAAPDLTARVDEHHRWLIGRAAPPPPDERRETAWLAQRRRLRVRDARTGRFTERLPWWATVDAAGRLLTPRHLQPWRLG